MSRLDELLEGMYADEKFMGKKSMQSKTYTDEPIIKRASAMKNYTPPQIAEMRALAEGQSSYNWSSPRLFVRQGRLMADYEDDFTYSGTFFRYYPTYQLMSDVQLRGYFSWRTKVRRGQIEYIPLSFVFVYLYELLNQIGAASPEEGFEKLTAFGAAYAPIDGSAEHYLRDWLVDYAAYYGLDPALIRDAESLAPYRQYTVLSQWRQHPREELFAAIVALSSYNIEKSKFYRAYPEDTRAVLCRTFAAFSEHHAARCKNSLCERLFGKVHTLPYTMFSSAVVALDRNHPDADYEIFPWYGYACRGGTWYRTRLDRSPAKNRKLGELVRDVDAILRERYGFDAPLKATDKTKVFTNLVNAAIDEWQEEKRQKAAAVIRIDIGKLDAIRSDAAETGEKLMTAEERGDESGVRSAESGENAECGMRNAELNAARSLSSVVDANPVARSLSSVSEGIPVARSLSSVSDANPVARSLSSVSDANPVARSLSSVSVGSGKSEVGSQTALPLGSVSTDNGKPDAAPAADGLPLDATEAAVLRAVLNGGDGAAEARAGGRLLSVVIDAINDRLFDRFGDTVIYYEGDTPAVYEDYLDELKGLTQT